MMPLDDSQLAGPRVADIVRRARVARIATLSRNRRPSINPLYFVTVSGAIHLGTSDRTLAAFNVKADPRVTLLLNVERAPEDRRVLRIRGHARVSTDAGVCKAYVRRIVRKYFLNWDGLSHMIRHARLWPVMRRYHGSGEKGKRCVIEVLPEHVEWLTAP
jgi:hypothetical protein